MTHWFASLMILAVIRLLLADVLHAQGMSEIQIREVLDMQVEAWNRGDIETYMKGYWKSDSLLFTSDGSIQRGWTGTLEKYKKSYDSKTKMGVLTFTDLRIHMLSPESAWVFGRWALERKEDRPQGLFTLVMRKFPEGWRIVHDHTSAAQ